MTRLLARGPNSGTDGEMSMGDVNLARATDKGHKLTSGEPRDHHSGKLSSGGEEVVEVHQLIDLTDRPVRLTREEISWSRVKSNASNCICCCCDNSITLVTTDDSYVLNHIPLDNIEAAQANSGLQYLALANDEKLAVIDLLENKLAPPKLVVANGTNDRLPRPARACGQDPATQTRVVNLAALGLSMSDVLFWRWLDELALALVTRDALFTSRVDQIHINHPATTALGQPINQLLSLQRVCDIDSKLGQRCQITDVQRDASTNLYAISGLYSPHASISLSEPSDTQRPSNDISRPLANSDNNNHDKNNNNNNNTCTNINNNSPHNTPVPNNSTLRRNFSSVPSRLYQMAGYGGGGGNQQTNPSEPGSRSNNSSTIGSLRRKISSSSKPKRKQNFKCDVPTIVGLTQIHCKMRNRSQVIRAHAVSFTSVKTAEDVECHRTTLVAAKRLGNKLRVYFIGMATTEDLTTNGQNMARSIKMDPQAEREDFPTAIICSTLTPGDERTHIAMVMTKHGHLYACSISQGCILFDVQISNDIVCGVVLESKSRGLMLISRNGQVLLVRINEDQLRRMIDETSSLRYVPSRHAINLGDFSSSTPRGHADSETQPQTAYSSVQEPSDMGLEVIISTKL